MPRTVPTGRDHEVVKCPPTVLDCGHPFAGNVVVGFNPAPDGQRRRSYWCRTCERITWD